MAQSDMLEEWNCEKSVLEQTALSAYLGIQQWTGH